jgi:NitT/TauT family transport system substrate-binding protein
MIRNRPILIVLILAGMLLGCSIASVAESSDLKKISFLPQWQPQAQFAGYYMAQHRGFFRRYGIEVTIIQGGPSQSPTEYLKEKRAEIVTLWLSSALQLTDQGVEVVNIGQIMPRSALILVAKTRSGIQTPADMNGKKIALWPADFQIQPKAFFDKYNLKVQIVNTQSPVNLFLRDGVQVASLMWYNEYHTLINSGLDPKEMRLFSFDDYGLNFPEDGIYMLRETFDKDPESACAFAAASLEGWRYAFAHPEEAIDLIIRVMEAAHIPANRVHQRWMLDRIRDLTMSDAKGHQMGDLQIEDYQRVGDILIANGLIHTIPSYASFFKKCTQHD